MDRTQGVLYLQNILVFGVSMTCFILATKCLPKNVAHNLQLVCLFPFIMLFYLIPTSWGSGYFKQLEIKLNRGDFSIHWNILLVLFYVSDLLFLHVSSYFLFIFLISLLLLWQVVFLLRLVPSINYRGQAVVVYVFNPCTRGEYKTGGHRSHSQSQYEYLWRKEFPFWSEVEVKANA